MMAVQQWYKPSDNGKRNKTLKQIHRGNRKKIQTRPGFKWSETCNTSTDIHIQTATGFFYHSILCKEYIFLSKKCFLFFFLQYCYCNYNFYCYFHPGTILTPLYIFGLTPNSYLYYDVFCSHLHLTQDPNFLWIGVLSAPTVLPFCTMYMQYINFIRKAKHDNTSTTLSRATLLIVETAISSNMGHAFAVIKLISEECSDMWKPTHTNRVALTG